MSSTKPPVEAAVSREIVQFQCAEFLSYKVKNDSDIEYKGRVVGENPNFPAVEYYSYLKKGDKNYEIAMKFVLGKDVEFLKKRFYSETIKYKC